MTINTSKREFYIIIERDEDGYYIGEVPYLKACYSQGETIDELMVNMKEVIELCLEVESDENIPKFVGIQKVLI
ncbi:type II toxin-antitoxin system HicB family antitoxin [Scytonema hofmannii FACHB-248]|uniref:Type II toxin-antitoxin system HicB family antitoxin n=1 Tax=Scytonema hofmannii FACHB-248 TaxID=1842502 RepID=A0ABR8GRE9_9CYAN|nr:MULTISPECIES: type II toxin-antitoxin system HicB family antitoxin [Nostocales]MBD2605323.1 type II toxin-antitoxin system HicB family antitoxin [Scytonema hofmannii FACHB-248]